MGAVRVLWFLVAGLSFWDYRRSSGESGIEAGHVEVGPLAGQGSSLTLGGC
jgi:hypothetical protein